jgi:hypothetical protein
MPRAFLERPAQKGLPVHQRCVLTPAGYPGLFSPSPKSDRSHQCISGYLISTEVGGDGSSRTNLAELLPCAAGMFFSRSTHTDTLATTEREADCHDHMIHGD